MRGVATIAVLVALLTTGACAGRAQTHSDYPRYGGYGTASDPGLAVLDGSCLYDRSSMLAAGTIRQTAAQPGGNHVSVTLFVPVGTGAVHFERTVDYPAPATTGTDVPFGVEVDTAGQPGMACEIQVSWAG